MVTVIPNAQREPLHLTTPGLHNHFGGIVDLSYHAIKDSEQVMWRRWTTSESAMIEVRTYIRRQPVTFGPLQLPFVAVG